ncbi:ABC transporter family substrate-binding protein [Nanchangia anserum]|uniref:ABC transporter family substrate-binding protein n=1 Tax=Nanchangia anserum TaxID=2692125 RepID=UPI001D12D503|nr:ABC transporter family substrate-binding protein [Nanchangia anserum]
MRLKRISAACAALTVSAALALTGCSGDSKGSGSGGNGGSDQAKTTDINPQDRDKLKQGGTLRVAITQLPTNWNILAVDGNQVDNSDIFYWTGVNTLESNDKGEVSPNKNYLTGWDVEEAKDGQPQKVTLHINPKAKWNMGRQIDWQDYQSLWKACNGENKAFTPASTDGFDKITSIEKGETDQDVVITYKSTQPDWQAPISQLYPREMTSDPNMFNSGMTEPNNDYLAGPFIFDKIDKAQRVATIVPNPKWWGDKPMLDSVSFRELEDSASSQAFANSEIDVATFINSDGYNQAKNRADGEIRAAGSLQWRHVTINSQARNLGDEKVRQAITRGINREAVAKSDLAGLPVANTPEQVMLGNHFFMPGQEGYADNGEKWSYDAEAAGKLLDEAGWKLPEGKKIREKDGQPLSIDYMMLKDVPTSENEGKLIQADLAKIGIDVKMVTKAQDEFPKFLIDGDFGLTTFTWQGTIFPMNNIGQIYGSDSESNYARLNNTKLDELRDQADAEMDHAKRVDLTNEIDAMIWEEGHTIPLYRRIGYVGVPKNLANYGSFGLESIVPENVGYVK